MIRSDAELVHYQVTKAIRNGNLKTPSDHEAFTFTPYVGQGWNPSKIRKSRFDQNVIYVSNYEPLIKDKRFYFKYNEQSISTCSRSSYNSG
jgi:hypothetical protein